MTTHNLTAEIANKLGEIQRDLQLYADQSLYKRQLELAGCNDELSGSNDSDGTRLQLELKINELARKILQTPSLQHKKKILNQLRTFRIQLIPNTSKYYESMLELNLIQGIPVTPHCPAYLERQVPSVSAYHFIGPNLESIRLDPQAMKNVPRKLLEQMGDLSKHTVDLFFTVINGSVFEYQPLLQGYGVKIDYRSEPLNLSMHRWCHQHAHPGDDVKADPELIVFPIIGVERAPNEQLNPRHKDNSRVDPIGFDHLKQFQVHTHPRGSSKSHEDMLYSPDNIHFNITPESPFALFWSGAKLNDRACLTKMLLIIDSHDPICEALLETMNYCESLQDHLLRLDRVKAAIDQMFDPIIEQFKAGNPAGGMQLYDVLAPMYKTRIHEKIWVLQNKPMGIHHDFGRLSFEESTEIPLHLHSSNQQRAEAIRLFKENLIETLIGSQITLLIDHLALARSDNSITLMKCAQAFHQSIEKGMQSFDALLPHLKEAVRFAFWEISGAPRIPNFGTDHFPADQNKTNIEALLLAASRQNDHFVPQIEEIVEDAPFTPSSHSSSSSDLENPRSATLLGKDSSAGLNFLYSAPEEIVLDQLLQMSQSEEFLSKTAEERTACINEVLASLPTKFQDGVYWHYYQQYKQAHPDEQGIGGDNWGGRNIGKDIGVCLEAFMTVHMG